MVGDIGGRMTVEDLANYEVVWSEPARGSYRGFDLYAHGSPAEGGIGLIEAMNLAELAGVSNTATTRLARGTLLADPDRAARSHLRSAARRPQTASRR